MQRYEIIRRVPPVPEALRACRGCLETDCELQELSQNGLDSIFVEVTSLKVTKGDGRPQHICNVCRSLLMKFKQFRNRCVRAHHLLFKDAPMEYIRQTKRVNPMQVLSMANMVHFECGADDDDAMDVEPTTVPALKTEDLDSEVKTKEENDDISDKHDAENETVSDEIIESYKTPDWDCYSVKQERAETYTVLESGEEDENYTEIDYLEDVDDNGGSESKVADDGRKFKSLGEFRHVERCQKYTVQDFIDITQDRDTDDTVKLFYNYILNKFVHMKNVSKNEFWDVNEKYDAKDDELHNQYDTVNKSDNENRKRFYEYLIQNYRNNADDTENNDKEDEEYDVPLARLRQRRKGSDTSNLMMTTYDVRKFEKTYNMKLEIFKTKEDAIASLQSQQQKYRYRIAKFKCDKCSLGFQQETLFTKHMALHSPASGSYSCEVCQRYFSTTRLLKTHQQTHKIKATCTVPGCNLSFIHWYLARQHHRNHEDKYICEDCGKVFRKYKSRVEHRRIHHGGERCPLCHTRLVAQPAALKLHRRKMHPVVFTCPDCSHEFASQTALDTHLPQCGKDQFPCAACGATYGGREELQLHIEGEHTHKVKPREPRVYDHSLCKQALDATESLDDHSLNSEASNDDTQVSLVLDERTGDLVPLENPKKRKRQSKGGCKNNVCSEYCLYANSQKPRRNAKRFVCEICALSTHARTLLQEHMRIHTGERPYACPHCPKRFRTKTVLKFHIPVHTGERAHACERCGKAFKTPTARTKHQLVHTGVRAFACSICHKSYQTKYCVQMHIKTFHMQEPWPKRPPRVQKGK